MHLRIRSEGFTLTHALHEFVHDRLRHALGRFATLVEAVRVRLRDENGPRGGLDKRCQLEVQVKGQRPLVIDERGADLYAAIGRGAQRVERQVARAVVRRRQVQR